jgi:hypothetical protein
VAATVGLKPAGNLALTTPIWTQIQIGVSIPPLKFNNTHKISLSSYFAIDTWILARRGAVCESDHQALVPGAALPVRWN